jgi:hypothetical protein
MDTLKPLLILLSLLNLRKIRLLGDDVTLGLDSRSSRTAFLGSGIGGFFLSFFGGGFLVIVFGAVLGDFDAFVVVSGCWGSFLFLWSWAWGWFIVSAAMEMDRCMDIWCGRAGMKD